MSAKGTNVLWAISLILIGTVTILLVGSKLLDTRLPDIAVRILGITDLVGLSLLFFSTVKKLQKKA